MTIPIIRPTLPKYEEIEDEVREIIETGMLTNGKYVRKFEEAAAEYLDVKHVIAVSSCTTGLMLALSALPKESEVIMPGFTFSGTYQAVEWDGLKAVIVDVDESCNINPQMVEEAITDKTSAILGVHISGVPCDIKNLEKIAINNSINLFFDAAHAFGSIYHGKHIGNFGMAEVFSLGATKTLAVGEGGLIATNDDEFAERMKLAVNHGHGFNSLDYLVKGLNARIQEFNGILGLRELNMIDWIVERKNKIVGIYKNYLSEVPGISFPHIPENVVCTFKDFSMFVDSGDFGIDRDTLAIELEKRGIQTKKYYYPPIHRLAICKKDYDTLTLPNTEKKSSTVLSIPSYAHMPLEDVNRIIESIKDIRESK